MKRTIIRIIVCVLLMSLALYHSPASAATKVIPSRSSQPNVVIRYAKVGGVGNCTSWLAACELQTAINVAAAGNQIWVQAGIHKPSTSGLPDPRAATFTLKSGVQVYGGFAGTETSLVQRDFVTNVTTLSGDIGTASVNTDNSYHVVTGDALLNTTLLDGFTISGGYGNGSLQNQNYGAGMYLTSSAPQLKNLVISSNSAIDGVGGGIYSYQGNINLQHVTFTANFANTGGGLACEESASTLNDVTFSGNTALIQGGGMHNEYGGPATLKNVTFSHNSVTQESGGGMSNLWNATFDLDTVTFDGNTAINYGGGMYNNSNSNGILAHVTFLDNSATRGGGLYNKSNTVTVTYATFNNNSASYAGGGSYVESVTSFTLDDATFTGNTSSQFGGGMHSQYSSPALNRVVFDDNHATSDYGGGFYCTVGEPTLKDIEFKNNVAGALGGGAMNYTCNATYTNVLFDGNSAVHGGGMSNFATSHPRLDNVTFFQNTASGYGAAIYNYNQAILELYNGTIYQNTATDGGGAICSGEVSETTMMSTIVWGNLPAANQILNDTGNYSVITYSDIQGGWEGSFNLDQDPLLGPLADNGGFTKTFAIHFGSPAIDGGANTYKLFDQRNLPRPVDGDGNGVAQSDMGAYEAQAQITHTYLPLIKR